MSRVFALHGCIGMHCSLYWHVSLWICATASPAASMCSSQCTRVFLCTRRLSASVLMWYVLGMYWYVLGGISKYLHVLDQILIADILIQCHTAFQSTFNAICTVDTPELSLNWISSPQDGQRERPWPKHQCRTVPLRLQSQPYPHIFIPSWVVLAQHCWESFLYVSALIDVYLHALYTWYVSY